MRKILFSALLLCVLGLFAACFMSIYAETGYDSQKDAREAVVRERLLQIRDLEELYKQTYGDYCGTLDSLILFMKEGKVVEIYKEGELTDDQLEAGLTEAQAVRQGIIRRDSNFYDATEKIKERFIADKLGTEILSTPESLKYVPVGRVANGEFTVVNATYDENICDSVYQGMIQLRKKSVPNLKTGDFDVVVEARASMDDYLDAISIPLSVFGLFDINIPVNQEKKFKNIKADLKKKSKNAAPLFIDNEDNSEGEWYGLRIGDLSDPTNKMNGNWE